jgi:very-short-patch-repair endonuclease
MTSLRIPRLAAIRNPAHPAVARRPAGPSKLEAELALQLRAFGLPEPVHEHRFNQFRLWRFDFAWPDEKVAVEVEGGVWTGGRHTRASGFIADCEKYNEAELAGWTVLRVAGQHVASGEAVIWIRRALGIP